MDAGRRQCRSGGAALPGRGGPPPGGRGIGGAAQPQRGPSGGPLHVAHPGRVVGFLSLAAGHRSIGRRHTGPGRHRCVDVRRPRSRSAVAAPGAGGGDRDRPGRRVGRRPAPVGRGGSPGRGRAGGIGSANRVVVVASDLAARPRSPRRRLGAVRGSPRHDGEPCRARALAPARPGPGPQGLGGKPDAPHRALAALHGGRGGGRPPVLALHRRGQPVPRPRRRALRVPPRPRGHGDSRVGPSGRAGPVVRRDPALVRRGGR